MRVFLLFALMTVVFTASAQANGVRTCGVPVDDDTSTVATGPSADFCNIYTRQLAYPEQLNKLHNQLVERQKNFYAPRKEAHDAYVKEVEALHAKVGSGNVGNK